MIKRTVDSEDSAVKNLPFTFFWLNNNDLNSQVAVTFFYDGKSFAGFALYLFYCEVISGEIFIIIISE